MSKAITDPVYFMVPGAHFTDGVSIIFKIWQKFHFALFKMRISCDNYETLHVMTAELPCHAQNIVTVWFPGMGLLQNQFSSNLKYSEK